MANPPRRSKRNRQSKRQPTHIPIRQASREPKFSNHKDHQSKNHKPLWQKPKRRHKNSKLHPQQTNHPSNPRQKPKIQSQQQNPHNKRKEKFRNHLIAEQVVKTKPSLKPKTNNKEPATDLQSKSSPIVNLLNQKFLKVLCSQ